MASAASAAPPVHAAGVVQHVSFARTQHARLLVLGDAGCGKSSWVRALTGQPFDVSYDFSTAPAVSSVAVAAPEGGGGGGGPAQVSFVVVDVPGASVFHHRTLPGLWASAAAVAVCFDVASAESLKSASKWLRRVQEAKAAAGVSSDALPGVLLGFKADTRDAAGGERAEVQPSDAVAVAAGLGLRYYELSALRGAAASLDEPLKWLAGAILV